MISLHAHLNDQSQIQCLLEFSPSPDWYFSYLWKNLMARTVLSVDGMLDKGRVVRSYAFCAKSQASEHVSFPLQQGDVVIVVSLDP